jgi:beta-N-acetylhexosaminidase
MRALGGGIGERVEQALAAGCDVVLHCNGDPEEMREVAAARPISARSAERLARAEVLRQDHAREGFDRREAEAQLDALLGGAQTSELAAR